MAVDLFVFGGAVTSDDDERGDLPSLTLIFQTTDKENADWDRLLDLSEHAYAAIEAHDPRFSILKAFTFYAGADEMSTRARLDATEKKLAAAEAVVEALDAYETARAMRLAREYRYATYTKTEPSDA